MRPLPPLLALGEDEPDLDATRDAEFIAMPVKEILNRCANPQMPFRWTINPYRGCEFGCVYCYARYTHDFLELRGPMDFERRVFVKRMAAQVLVRSLSRTSIGNDAIAIGTATDPYQPAERKFEVTRGILEVLSRVAGLNLSITTKSALVARDLDLLTRIAARSNLTVNFSCISLNRRLQRLLEPRAPRPEVRMRAMRALTSAGVRCCVLVMPVIPGLTDEPRTIEAVIRAAKAAGASGVWWRPLFLKPAAARRFIPFVRERFPEIAPQLDSMYARNAYTPASYGAKLEAIFDRLRRKYGFPCDREICRSRRLLSRSAAQLSLAV